MKVTVNEKCVETSAEDAPSEAGLDTLLDDLKKRGDIPQGEVVVSLEVNGRRWTSGDMDRLGDTLLRDVSHLAVGTADVREYGRRVLEDAGSMISVLHEGAQAIAVEFRQRTPEEASSHLFLLLDAIQSLFGCLFRVINTCGPKSSSAQDQGRLVQGVMSALEAIQACQEQQDWKELANRLEIDLLPALDACGAVIGQVRKEL